MFSFLKRPADRFMDWSERSSDISVSKKFAHVYAQQLTTVKQSGRETTFDEETQRAVISRFFLNAGIRASSRRLLFPWFKMSVFVILILITEYITFPNANTSTYFLRGFILAWVALMVVVWQMIPDMNKADRLQRALENTIFFQDGKGKLLIIRTYDGEQEYQIIDLPAYSLLKEPQTVIDTH